MKLFNYYDNEAYRSHFFEEQNLPVLENAPGSLQSFIQDILKTNNKYLIST